MRFYPMAAELLFGKASSWVVPAFKKLHLSSMSKYPGSFLPELQALGLKMRDPSFHAYPYIQPVCFVAYNPLVPVTALQLFEQLQLPFCFTFPSLHPLPFTPLERAASSLACSKICPLVQKAPVQLRDSVRDLLTISVFLFFSHISQLIWKHSLCLLLSLLPFLFSFRCRYEHLSQLGILIKWGFFLFWKVLV